jgi:cyclopropane fatty-acyl-phospholipid synthase-like methyltransferase
MLPSAAKMAASAALWEEAAECGVCGSRDWRLAETLCQRRYVSCLGCTVHRLYDRVAEARLDLLYGRGYYSTDDPSPAELAEQLHNPTFAHRRARLDASVTGPDRTFLEIGCGDGNFLAVLRNHRWQVQGQEFSAEAAALVERRHRIPVLTGDIASISPERPYGAIGAYHVFEHVYHPRAWLQRVRQLLRPAGVLHLQLPNGGALTRTLTQRAWAGWVFPEHVYFYSPATLSSLLEGHGFAVLAVTTWDPWHGPGTVSRSLTNLANRARTGRLPWTDTLGVREPAASSAAANGRGRNPLKALARTALEGVSGTLARVEAVVGRGEVVDVIARRRGEPG